MKTIALADLTRVNAGTETQHLNRLKDEAGAEAEYVAIVRPDQVDITKQLLPETALIDCPNVIMGPAQVAAAVSRHVVTCAASADADARIFVVSYHGPVIALRHGQSIVNTHRVEYMHWLQLVANPTISVAASGIGAATWPINGLTEEAVVQLMRSAMTANGHVSRQSALRQTNLRPLLTRYEPRLMKSNAPHPRVGSMLLSAGIRSGLIEVDTSDKDNPWLWLRSSGTAGSNGAAHASVPSSNGSPSSAESAKAQADAKPRTRSDTFIDTLRTANLGPYPGLRHQMYDVLEKAVKGATTSISPLELVAKTVEGSTEDAAGRRYARDGVRRFLTRLLASEAVLVSEDGTAFALSAATADRPVKDLCPDWKIALDGVLVHEIARRHGDVGMLDIEDLAGALLLARDHGAVKHIHSAAVRLIAKGRLDEISDGTTIGVWKAK